MKLFGIGVALLQAATAVAQVITASAAVGAAGITAVSPGSYFHVPAGTPLTTPITVTSGGGTSYTAMSYVTFAASPYRKTLVINQATTAAGPPGQAATTARGNLNVVATQSIFARVNVNLPYPVHNPGSSTTGFIDIGANGSIELLLISFAQPSVSFPITIAPGALTIVADVNATSATGFLIGSTMASRIVEVALEPDPDWTTTTAPSTCGVGAPVLVAQPTYERTLDFNVTQLLPATITLGALVLGFAPTTATMPLPPFCLLGVSPDAVGVFTPNGSGQATHNFDMRPWPAGFSFHAQALAFNFATGELRSSARHQITKQ